MRVKLRADTATQRLDRLDGRLRAKGSACDEVGVTADILGQRVDRDIGAVSQGMLEDRPKQGVVAYQHGPEALGRSDFVGDLSQEPDIDERIGWIGRCLDQDERDPTLALRVPSRGTNGGLAYAVDKSDGA